MKCNLFTLMLAVICLISLSARKKEITQQKSTTTSLYSNMLLHNPNYSGTNYGYINFQISGGVTGQTFRITVTNPAGCLWTDVNGQCHYSDAYTLGPNNNNISAHYSLDAVNLYIEEVPNPNQSGASFRVRCPAYPAADRSVNAAPLSTTTSLTSPGYTLYIYIEPM